MRNWNRPSVWIAGIGAVALGALFGTETGRDVVNYLGDQVFAPFEPKLPGNVLAAADELIDSTERLGDGWEGPAPESGGTAEYLSYLKADLLDTVSDIDKMVAEIDSIKAGQISEADLKDLQALRAELLEKKVQITELVAEYDVNIKFASVAGEVPEETFKRLNTERSYLQTYYHENNRGVGNIGIDIKTVSIPRIFNT